MTDLTKIGGVLVLVILIVAISVPIVVELLSQTNEFTPDDACSDAGCSFNNPSGFCAINSSSEGEGVACPNDVRQTLPLNVLFSSVILIVIAIALFLLFRSVIEKIGK